MEFNTPALTPITSFALSDSVLTLQYSPLLKESQQALAVGCADGRVSVILVDSQVSADIVDPVNAMSWAPAFDELGEIFLIIGKTKNYLLVSPVYQPFVVLVFTN